SPRPPASCDRRSSSRYETAGTVGPRLDRPLPFPISAQQPRIRGASGAKQPFMVVVVVIRRAGNKHAREPGEPASRHVFKPRPGCALRESAGEMAVSATKR